MAITLKSTAAVVADGVKILCHGQSGAGKTHIIRSLPNPVIISAESGLLSLSDCNFPVIEVLTIEGVKEAYRWLIESDEAKQFDSIALDSISEIAEVVLTSEKARSKDGRAAYGEMAEVMSGIVRSFRDIKGKHVYMSAKTEKIQDEQGRIIYGPSMPGKTLTNAVSYWFDLVLAIRVEQDAEGKTVRALMCDSDGLWQAKNRGGRLDMWEAPDLGAIINKIGGQA